MKPYIVNAKMKPTANSMGFQVMEPRHMVAGVQLKHLHAGRTAISMVAYMKNSWPVTGMPDGEHVVRQTMKDGMAMEAVAYTIEV